MNAQRASRLASAALCGAFCVSAHAADAPQFDRPGLSFSTPSLAAGQVVWEQGLPDASFDDAGGVRSREYLADTVLRFGLSDAVELQLGADSYGHVDVRGAGTRQSASGAGDARAGLKWALPGSGDAFSWAALATFSFPTGQAPIGDGGYARDLGVTAAWTLTGDRGVTLYADRAWSDDGNGWLFSGSYAFPLRDALGGYVEAGVGTGSERTRVAGGGVTWMATPRVQLDASFLRGLDARSPDWQVGVGFSVFFARADAAR